MSAYFRHWRALPVRQSLMLLLLAAAVSIVNIHQPFPEIAPLQHLPTVLLILAAPRLLGCWSLSDRSVAAILIFFLLHTLGGRYTYSNLPYDDWARALTGYDITGSFGLARNQYDRLVHFSFGLLAIGPAVEVMERHAGMNRRAALWSAFAWVGAVSALYEVFEWLLTIVIAPGMAADYNGQQGDMWDSQKDMAIAMVGAIAAVILGPKRS